MPSRLYMLGICRQVTPYANVMKLGTVGPVGYVIALTAVGPHRLTGFGVSRHPSWVPSIDKAHRAYYIAVPATAGTHDLHMNCPSNTIKVILIAYLRCCFAVDAMRSALGLGCMAGVWSGAWIPDSRRSRFPGYARNIAETYCTNTQRQKNNIISKCYSVYHR